MLIRLILSVIILACSTRHSIADIRHIHVIKILDTENEDSNIRAGSRQISYAIDREVELLRENLAILAKPHYYEVVGSNFNIDKLKTVLEIDLNYLEEDIVIVVYVGHGKKADQNIIYPDLEIGLNYGEIYYSILNKRPSFILSMIFSCNATDEVYDGGYGNPPPSYDYAQQYENPTKYNSSKLSSGYSGNNSSSQSPYGKIYSKQEGFSSNRKPEIYKKMFASHQNLTKSVFLFAAEREHYTFISDDGGIFLREILNAFEYYFSLPLDKMFTWADLCQDIDYLTGQNARRKGLYNQRPNCYVDLSHRTIDMIGTNRKSRRGIFSSLSYECRYEFKSLKEKQKQALKNLRKQHKEEEKSARRQRMPRINRRNLVRQHRLILNELKVQQKTDRERLRANCK